MVPSPPSRRSVSAVPSLAAALVAALALATFASPTRRTVAQVTPLPDLVIDGPRLAASIQLHQRQFTATDCAIFEGCAGVGKRKLLRFTLAAQNVGTADVVLGDPQQNQLFAYSPCHHHYHLNGFALAQVLRTDGTTVVTGRKQAFCLLDSAPVPGFSNPSSGYDCFYQGITAGWQDVYDRSLDCQWVDVTNVPRGNYTLRVTVNPDGVIAESDRTNNTVSVPVRIR